MASGLFERMKPAPPPAGADLIVPWQLICSWMALGRRPILPLGTAFIFFYGRKKADMGGCRRRLGGLRRGARGTGREARGAGRGAKRGTHRDGAATGRRGRLPYGGGVRVSGWRTVQRTRSYLGEKGQRNAEKRGKRTANKAEWGRLPRTSRGQDGLPTNATNGTNKP